MSPTNISTTLSTGDLFQDEVHDTKEDLEEIVCGAGWARNHIVTGDVWERCVKHIHGQSVNDSLNVVGMFLSTAWALDNIYADKQFQF